MIVLKASIFDHEVSAFLPLSRKWKWIRGLYIAASCIPWFFLLLAWDQDRGNPGNGLGIALCWLIIVPISFLLAVSAPILPRLETRSSGPYRVWWYATALAGCPLMMGIVSVARHGPSLFGTK